MEARNWFVKVMHASFQLAGLPDLYIINEDYDPCDRWVEIKLPHMEGSKFTKAQKQTFPEFTKRGKPIWVLTEVTEAEYKKLFDMPDGNFAYYLMKKEMGF